MLRAALTLFFLAALVLGATVFARTHEAPVDRVQGIRINSRIPCDGDTNPQEELMLEPKFSPGGWQRALHLDVFESQYCKRLDLYFFCLSHGHDRWNHQWMAASQGPAPSSRYWINSCVDWQAKDAPEYILSAWYQEGPADSKLNWKQAAIKQVSKAPETYEFADPNGGTARLEIKRK